MIRVFIRRERAALRLAVDFHSDAAVLAIFGKSGAGKTTLLRVVAGLLRAEQVEVEVAGRTFASTGRRIFLAPEQRAIGYVAQEPLLFPHLSVAKNLSFGARRGGGAGARIAQEKVLDVLEIGPLLERGVTRLSGGEKRRVALGRALFSRPRLLLLDEPLAGLHRELRLRILLMLRRVFEEFRIPALLVSHSRTEVLSLAGEIVVLDEGQQIRQGEPAQVLRAGDILPMVDVGDFQNVLLGAVAAHDPEGGLSTITLAGGAPLRVPLLSLAIGEAVRIAIASNDIIIAIRQPQGLSVRSVLEGRVKSLKKVAGSLFVEVDAGVPIIARVTNAAGEELGLEPGRSVFLLVKAYAARRVG